MLTALVTGSRGFVGTYLCAQLRELSIEPNGFDLADGQDIRSYEQIRSAVDHVQPDLVFHLAAQAHVPEASADPTRAFAVNCDGTVNLLKAVHRVGLLGTRVHIAGTSEEYGWWRQPVGVMDEHTPVAPTTIYGASKACASIAALAYAEQHDLPVVVTRASNHTGPGQSAVYAVSSFAKRLMLIQAGKLDVLEHGDLSGWRDFLDVRDVVRAYTLAILADPGVYNIASGRARTMREILDQLCVIAGMEHAPTKENLAAHRRQRSIHFHMSSAKLTDRVGWRPQIAWGQTLTDLLGYWRERV